MSNSGGKVEADRQLIVDARQKGRGATLGAYLKLSGPGWLQSALTLGGGSLSNSLYLGVLAGFSLLWLQPFAMVLGIVMLSAIGYVTMSTGQRPFRAINEHVNPVLGWGWALASLLANMVWALPQYSLATGVVQQNLFPGSLGAEGDRGWIVGVILVISTAITWSYDRGGWGIKLYEALLKLLVALIVLCFVGVVVRLWGELHWGAIFAGFVPDFTTLTRPADTFRPYLQAVVSEGARQWWSDLIVADQRDVMIGAAATAVGINMTFLFPYSILKRGWGKEFRGLALFDLSTGMLIPFLLATSCVVIASATQFHTTPQPGLLEKVDASGASIEVRDTLRAGYEKLLAARVAAAPGADAAAGESEAEAVSAESLPIEEKRLAAMLVHRDAFDLAGSLSPLMGDFFARIVFGIGVLAMALSTITLLMLISGFVICEVFDLPPSGWWHRLGTLAAATGVLGPFLYKGEAKFWLAVPTSVFGFTLLPIAYLTFFFLMNQRRFLGPDMPRGARRLAWNTLMGVAAGLASFGSVFMVWKKAHYYGVAALALFVGAALVVHFRRRRSSDS